MRRAIAGAARKDRAAKMLVPKRSGQGLQVSLVTQIKPIGDDALDDEPAGESIEGEQSASLATMALGVLQTDFPGRRLGFFLRFDFR